VSAIGYRQEIGSDGGAVGFIKTTHHKRPHPHRSCQSVLLARTKRGSPQAGGGDAPDLGGGGPCECPTKLLIGPSRR